MHHAYVRRTLLTAVAVAALLVGAACGANDGGGKGGDDTTTVHNKADVMFAQMMVPHYRQTIQMTELAPKSGDNAQIKRLAQRIETAEGTKTKTMSSWLHSWGAKVPAGTAGMAGMPDGTISDSDMAKLRSATGMQFDMMFARMMITHQRGAISMDHYELTKGRNAAGKRLARQMLTSQSADVKACQQILSM